MDKTLLVKYENQESMVKGELKYWNPLDCGIDLYNAEGPVLVPPYKSISISAGVSVKIPDGYFGMIHSRSSTFMKKGLFVVGGIIDAGYVGPLYTIVWNPALNGFKEAITINPWERLSQLIIIPTERVNFGLVSILPDTERGKGGFGSTGD